MYAPTLKFFHIKPPFIPAPKGDWVFWRRGDKEKYDVEYDKDAPNTFDYAYCVTCHKCQGSEYDKVLVLEQKSSLWDNIRWSYTAASRAKEKLYWCN